MNFILQLVNKIWYCLSLTCCWLQDFSPQLVASPWHSYPFSTFRRIRNFFILELFLSLLMFLLPKKKRKYSTRKSVKGGWNLIRCGLCRVLEIENIWIDNVICWLISSMKFPGWISWWTSVGFLESRPKYFFRGSLFFWNNFFHPPLSGWEEVLRQLFPSGWNGFSIWWHIFKLLFSWFNYFIFLIWPVLSQVTLCSLTLQ